MAITFTGNGGLFTRLGRIFGGAADVIAIMGGTATARTLSTASIQTRATNIVADAAYSPAVSAQVDKVWSATSSWQSSQSSLFTQYRTMAENIVITQVNADTALASKDLNSALSELSRQMTSGSYYIAPSTVAIGAQTALGTPVGGTPVVVASIKNKKGYTLQTLFPEAIRVTVATDSTSGSTARQESLSIKGIAAISDVFAYNWPGGSGAATTLTLCDAQLDNSGGNKLYNSDFETFTTSNVPDNWIIATGTAGTHIFASGSTDAYTGSNALKITGDAGSTLSTVRQTFATTPSTTVGSGGTSGTLTAGEQYAVNGFVKVSAAPAAGVLRIRLVDGSNNVINDDSGTANSFTVSLTTQTTSYAAFNGTFRIPSVLPTTIKLEVGLSTAIDSGKSLYIDDLALTPMVSLYSGGPSFAAFASSTKVAVNDMWTLTTTNTMGGFAVWMERFFGMRDRGLQLAYSGTNAISDTLIA